MTLFAPLLLATPSAVASDGLHAIDLGTYAMAFWQGVLVDLTPCVYPLIPITVAVFGAKGVSRSRALFLASSYVLGMAVLYTSLGLLVATSGSAFGAWLGNPVVVLPIALLLTALAASMFGAFDLQLPSALQNRLNTVGGTGPTGAFLMGLVSGLISAPCTGPVLLSLLAYIAKASAEGQSILAGASVLFVYALGMGTLFFAVALGASLFRPGPWMEHVKSVFGIALLVMAVWFLRPLSPRLEGFQLHPEHGTWVGLGLVGVGVLAGAIHRSFHGPVGERLRKGAAVGLTTLGAVGVLNHQLYTSPMAWTHVATAAELQAIFDRAESMHRPVLIDFGATWCLPCKEIEVGTFHDPSVEPVLATRFELVKIDVTDPTPAQEELKEVFSSHTLPSVLVYDANVGLAAAFAGRYDGSAMPAPVTHITSLVDAPTFLQAIQPALD